MILVWIFVGVLAWCVLGGLVVQAIDDEQQRLTHWVDECPSPALRLVVLAAWPYVWWRFRAKDE